MTDANPRAIQGGNVPPLDAPDQLPKRLELEYRDLIAEAADMETARFGLPEAPATDEEAAQVSDFVVKLKGLAKRMETARTTSGRPYLEGQRVINDFFGGFIGDIELQTDPRKGALVERVNIFSRAKAERERAERLERERLERVAAEAKRQEEEAQRQEAARLQAAADAAAARIRQAADAATRAEAEKQMREADTAAAAARKAAEKAGDDAAKSERKADAFERAADGDIGKLSKVSAGGSTSSVTMHWTHAITDAGKLLESMGPLGVHISNDAVIQAIGRIMREAEKTGTIEALTVPGVRFFTQTQTNIRAARA